MVPVFKNLSNEGSSLFQQQSSSWPKDVQDVQEFGCIPKIATGAGVTRNNLKQR